MVAVGDRYQRVSDDTVHEIVKIMDWLSPPRGVLLGGTVGAWTVVEVTGAQLTADYVPFVDEIVVGDIWRDRHTAEVHRIAALFVADSTNWVALDPLNAGTSPLLVTEAQLKSRGQKVV
jgi:hypothetical protein